MEFIVAIIIALLLAILFSTAFGYSGTTWEGVMPLFLTFFLLIFLAAWAAGLWFAPFGPVLLGVAWLPILFVALLAALLLAAFTPQRSRGEPVPAEGTRAGEEVAVGISVFFWVAVVFLLGAIIAGYLLRP
jgi:hypothetical protein